MNKFFLTGFLVVVSIVVAQAQASDTYKQKEIDKNLVDPPGARMIRTGRGLTIAGSVLFITGVVLMANADETYYTSTTSNGGTEEQGDPKFALGLLSAMGGAGMIIPGAIIWSKGSKKLKAYKQNPQSRLMLGTGRNGVGLRIVF